MKIIQEFKQFAVKGNALDMAVAIIVGVAFNKVVNSIVHDIIMPPIGLLVGGVDFRHLQIVLRDAVAAIPEAEGIAAVAAKPEVAIRYGLFANNVLEFTIVAFSVFVIVKAMNRLILKREAAQAKAQANTSAK